MVTKKIDDHVCTKNIPIPNGVDIISKGTEYFRICKAAEILGCTADDLLHLGVTGHAEIMAPVLSEGAFAWPMVYPGMGESFRRNFNASDRVFLFNTDLALIEAKGWVIPTSFFAPYEARRKIYQSQGYIDKRERDCVEIFGRKKDFSQVVEEWKPRSIKKWEPDADLVPPQGMSFDSAWNAVDSIDEGSEKTTIHHLFISKEELQRLVKGQPQDAKTLARNRQRNEQVEKSNHGNGESNAIKREPILKVAIYCLINSYGSVMTATELANKIELESRKFWPDTGSPPLALSTIEELLREIFKGNIFSSRRQTK